LINREPTEQRTWNPLELSAGRFNWITDEKRNSNKKSRDAFLQSDADAGCLVLAEALGIKKELEERFLEKCKDIHYNFSDIV